MTTITPTSSPTVDATQLAKVRKVIESHTFAVLSTTSSRERAHAAGVLYDAVDGELWVHTMRSSRKARNVAANPHVAVCLPFRKLPVGPPYTLQFQATAALVPMDDPSVRALLADGELGHISGYGALDEPDGVFIRITADGVVHSYGLGVNPVALVRDPLHTGARTVDLRQG